MGFGRAAGVRRAGRCALAGPRELAAGRLRCAAPPSTTRSERPWRRAEAAALDGALRVSEAAVPPAATLSSNPTEARVTIRLLFP